MTEELKKPSGVMFRSRQKTKETQPDHTGHVELDIDMVKALVAKVKENQANDKKEHVKLNIAAWENISANGSPYMKAKASIPLEKKKDQLDDEIPF